MFLLSVAAFGQSAYLHQVFVANGGDFSNPDDYVTVGAYEPSTTQFTVFDTIFTQSVQDMVVMDESFVFVAAENELVKYHADSYERLATVQVPGIHELAVGDFPYQDHLIVGKWFGTLDNEYVQVYDANLNLLFTTEEVEGDTDGIYTWDDYFVVANPGPFGSTEGAIHVFNLADLSYIGKIDLGAEGTGISSFFRTNALGASQLYALGNQGWGSEAAYLFEIDISSMSVESTSTLNHGVSSIIDVGDFGEVFYLDWDGNLGYFDLGVDEYNTLATGPFASADISYEHNTIVATDASFSDAGNAYVFELDGQASLDFAVGISPEAVALDMRLPSSIEQTTQGLNGLVCYPQPARDQLNIRSDLDLQSWRITDITAKVILQSNSSWNGFQNLDVSDLRTGVYVLEAVFEKGTISQKIIIE